MLKYVDKGLLYEYTNILAGNATAFPEARFSKKNQRYGNEAVEVYRYGFEIFMHWSPEETRDRISVDVIRKLKLEKLVKYLNLPPELESKLDQKRECLTYFTHDDLLYIVHLMYPSIVPYDKSDLITQTLRNVINGTKDRFPKKYFEGYEGMTRAGICMHYIITHHLTFHSYEEMFKFFSSSQGVKELSNFKLKTPMKDIFGNPIDMLSLALTNEDRRLHPEIEFYYHYYKFLYSFEDEYGNPPEDEPYRLTEDPEVRREREKAEAAKIEKALEKQRKKEERERKKAEKEEARRMKQLQKEAKRAETAKKQAAKES